VKRDVKLLVSRSQALLISIVSLLCVVSGGFRRRRRAAQAASAIVFSAGSRLLFFAVDTALSLSPASFGSASRCGGYTVVVFRGSLNPKFPTGQQNRGYYC
jgi:hypothetical protein